MKQTGNYGVDTKAKLYTETEMADGIDNLTGYQLNVLKLLHCIASSRRGHTYEQNIYLKLLENEFFPEED